MMKLRVLAGTLVAFLAMSISVFALSVAPWFGLGVDGVLKPGVFDTRPAFNAYAVLVGILGALFAGWLCARISRSKTAVLLLALVACAGGFVNAFAQSRKPDPGARVSSVTVAQAISVRKEPAWFTLLMPVVGFVAVLIGGRSDELRE
jgi:MFS family permease